MSSVKVRKYQDSVYVIYCHKNEKFKIFTGVRVQNEFWNHNTPKKNCPDYKNVITQISSTEARVINASMKVRMQGLDPSVQLVRKEYFGVKESSITEKLFWESYGVYLNLHTCKASTKRKLEVSRKVYNYFCRYKGYKADIDTFDKIVLGHYIQYMLLNQGMADSTVNRHVRALRTFLRFAYPKTDTSFVKYSMLVTDKEIIALSEMELKLLIEFDLSGYLKKTRDLFVFLATTGMRYSDSQLYDQSWETLEQVLEFIQLKTGGKLSPTLRCR